MTPNKQNGQINIPEHIKSKWNQSESLTKGFLDLEKIDFHEPLNGTFFDSDFIDFLAHNIADSFLHGRNWVAKWVHDELGDKSEVLPPEDAKIVEDIENLTDDELENLTKNYKEYETATKDAGARSLSGMKHDPEELGRLRKQRFILCRAEFQRLFYEDLYLAYGEALEEMSPGEKSRFMKKNFTNTFVNKMRRFASTYLFLSEESSNLPYLDLEELKENIPEHRDAYGMVGFLYAEILRAMSIPLDDSTKLKERYSKEDIRPGFELAEKLRHILKTFNLTLPTYDTEIQKDDNGEPILDVDGKPKTEKVPNYFKWSNLLFRSIGLSLKTTERTMTGGETESFQTFNIDSLNDMIHFSKNQRQIWTEMNAQSSAEMQVEAAIQLLKSNNLYTEEICGRMFFSRLPTFPDNSILEGDRYFTKKLKKEKKS